MPELRGGSTGCTAANGCRVPVVSRTPDSTGPPNVEILQNICYRFPSCHNTASIISPCNSILACVVLSRLHRERMKGSFFGTYLRLRTIPHDLSGRAARGQGTAGRLDLLGPPQPHPRLRPPHQDDHTLPAPDPQRRRTRASNARSESTNTHLRLLTRRAYGYHSPDSLIAMADFARGRLCPPLPGRARKITQSNINSYSR
jgi:transposase